MSVDSDVAIGLIAGIGQTSVALQQVEPVVVPTPYGPTSTPVRIIEVHGRQVAVITRRGEAENIPAHRVPYRANLWALASLGVRAVIANTASTGLHAAFTPGHYVVPDDVIDFSTRRDDTFFDTATDDSAVQVPTTAPFDSTLRNLAVEALQAEHVRVRDFGTIAVTSGPRFPSESESRAYAALGAHLTNMTAMPETILARELGIGIVNVSLITDHAAGAQHEHTDAQTLDLIRRRAAQAQPTLLKALARLVTTIPTGYTPQPHTPDTTHQHLLAQPPTTDKA